MNERYYIDVFDYALFSFNKKNYAKFMTVCRENNIFLEVEPKILGDKESYELFKKIKFLRDELDKCNELSKIRDYEREISDLRTRLFEGYQLMIWRIIGSNFPDIKESMYRDDVIQMGYVYLVRAIDNFDVDRAPSFDWYLSSYVLNSVFRDVKYIDKNIISNKDLIKLEKVRQDIREDGNDLVTLDILVRKTGFSEEKINELLRLEGLINTDSIEEITDYVEIYQENIEQDNKNMEIFYGEDLMDCSLEGQVSDKIFRELLLKIIDTLPDMQKQVVIKYCGFDGNTPLSSMEMVDYFGITRQMVHIYLSCALDNLKSSVRLKYIKELVEGYTELEFLDDEINESYIEKNRYEKLELFLLNQIPKEELLELISLIDIKYQRPLLSYLGLIDSELSYFDRINKLGMSVNTYLKRKDDGLIRLRRLIKEKYVLDSKNQELDDSMDYLMYRYLKCNKTRVRTR